MVITEEINKQAEKREEINKLKYILKNFNLPKYHFEETSDSLSIVEGKIFKGTVADLKLKDDIIEVYFTDEKDLEFLRSYFEETDIKFNLIVGDEYY